MKILISAFACGPSSGSERFIGWRSILAIAKKHDVWVATAEGNRQSIDAARDAEAIPQNLHFLYFGNNEPPHPNRLLARLQGWLKYHKWSRMLLSNAREWHREFNFDLAHHVTYMTWRISTPLWKLGIPTIWGPIGGAEKFPSALLPILSSAARKFERLRDLSDMVSARSPAVKQCVRHSTAIFAGNEETRSKLLELGAKPDQVTLLSGAFFTPEDEAKFYFPTKNYYGRLELFAGGNLEGRKGITVALKALRRVADAGVDFRYTLGGAGPEAAFVKELTSTLGLNENVEFSDGFRGKAYSERLGASHIFLMPSLRESAGLTLMEAMLAGCVPVVACGGGPGTIVTDECGFRINPASEEHMEIEIARRVIELSQSRSRLLEMGDKARARIQDNYSEKHYQDVVFRLYDQLTQD